MAQKIVPHHTGRMCVRIYHGTQDEQVSGYLWWKAGYRNIPNLISGLDWDGWLLLVDMVELLEISRSWNKNK